MLQRCWCMALLSRLIKPTNTYAMLFTGIVIFVLSLLAVAGLGLLVYVIVNRIKQKEKEDFPDRDN